MFHHAQIISALPGRNEARVHWSALAGFVEDERVALLFIQKRLYLIVPKRALSEAEWTEVRLLARIRGNEAGAVAVSPQPAPSSSAKPHP